MEDEMIELTDIEGKKKKYEILDVIYKDDEENCCNASRG